MTRYQDQMNAIFQNIEDAHTGNYTGYWVTDPFEVGVNYLDVRGTNLRIWDMGLVECLARTFRVDGNILLSAVTFELELFFAKRLSFRFDYQDYNYSDTDWFSVARLYNRAEPSVFLRKGTVVDLNLGWYTNFNSAVDSLKRRKY